MNFVADESVDTPIVERLRRQGHAVWSVAEMTPGITDAVVLDIANRETALLITPIKILVSWCFANSEPRTASS